MKRFSSESRDRCARFPKRWSNLITEITGGDDRAAVVPPWARLDGYSVEIKLLIVRGLPNRRGLETPSAGVLCEMCFRSEGGSGALRTMDAGVESPRVAPWAAFLQ